MANNALPKPEERPTLRVEEVAKILGIGRSTAYEAVGRGEIPTIRIGRRLLVPSAALHTLFRLYRCAHGSPSLVLGIPEGPVDTGQIF